MPNVFPGPFKGNERNDFVNFSHQPIAVAKGSLAIPAITINTSNAWYVDGKYFEQYNGTTSTAVMPTMGTIANNGLNIDTITGAAAKSIEITQGISAAQLNAFVAGTSPAFFVRATFNINTIANVDDLNVGFRVNSAYSATPDTYSDYANFGVEGASLLLQSQTNLASAGVVLTSSGVSMVAGQNFTVQVSVSSAGVASYSYALNNGPMLAATTAAYTFGAVTVVPYIIYSTVTSHTEVDLVSYACGLL